MSKLKFYKLLVIGLILINLALVAFFIFKKPHRPPSPREVIIERLDLSAQQIKQYDELIRVHRSNVEKTGKEIAGLKNSLYHQLNSEEQDSIVLDSIKNNLSLAHRRMENIHYDHFLDIKKICKTAQQEKFEELTKDIAKLFAPRRPPKHKRPRP